MKMKIFAAIALTALLFAGCATTDEKKDNDHYIPWWVKTK